MTEKKKVAIAMSGGVDSSVAAALLVEQGYDVFGLMLRLWVDAHCGEENRCCPPAAVAQARFVAGKIGIPFYVLDAQEPFRHAVVDYMVQSYSHGRTPNPCIECNRVVRWGYLRREARTLGADYLATGHYARILHVNGQPHLYRGLDSHKDQTYMLSALGPAELAFTLFPLGEMTKPAVRAKAQLLDLPVADKPDSQDLCFIPGGDYRLFLSIYAPDSMRPGPIVNRAGDVLGQHTGLAGYTIGQRKGIQISGPEPFYVLAMDLGRNALIIGASDELGGQKFIGDNIHWMNGQARTAPFRADVQIRYSSPAQPAKVIPLTDGNIRVEFDQPIRDITPGQAAVFYIDEECLGMAYIQEVIK
jgi:tRNA-uridine 2-sulfurtransferase